MNHPRYTRLTVALALLAAHPAFAQSGNDHWVATWTTAHLQAPQVRLGPVGQPATAAQQALAGFTNQTIRMIVPISIGGRRARVHLSNVYGSAPLVVGSA